MKWQSLYNVEFLCGLQQFLQQFLIDQNYYPLSMSSVKPSYRQFLYVQVLLFVIEQAVNLSAC